MTTLRARILTAPVSRSKILDLVRWHFLDALWKKDDARWNRCADILDREGKRIQRGYTAQPLAPTDAEAEYIATGGESREQRAQL